MTAVQRYAKKFNPKIIKEGDHLSRQYPKYRIEVTSSYGMNEETILFMEAVVEDNFNGRFETDALNKIQELVQGHLGGYWGIQFYEDPYMFFSTSFKRSPSFVVLDVSGSGIAIVKES
ncbi:Dynein light chain [Caenorhabditis elegans]|uniref:Dynein light chain n=1 Tax=Caenorhabditis elegans TaxID=6239 RepID=Q7YTM5_CAEEL|nr:Dynein light chain [Caenorhabditis elegans]CAE17825.1 Dynein light chain [Caenorhabditis elegans]|eukprot:NP_001023183.1 Uncharacterized protein CELE_F36H1.12 [Caenorhabditis elegans]